MTSLYNSFLLVQALADFDTAEETRFEDKCALYIARGEVRHLLGHSEEAANDFRLAYDLLGKGDKVRCVLQSVGLNASFYFP